MKHKTRVSGDSHRECVGAAFHLGLYLRVGVCPLQYDPQDPGSGASRLGSHPSSASGTSGQPPCPPVPEFLHLLLGVVLGLTER